MITRYKTPLKQAFIQPLVHLKFTTKNLLQSKTQAHYPIAFPLKSSYNDSSIFVTLNVLFMFF